jgi:hypothetical protein
MASNKSDKVDPSIVWKDMSFIQFCEQRDGLLSQVIVQSSFHSYTHILLGGEEGTLGN